MNLTGIMDKGTLEEYRRQRKRVYYKNRWNNSHPTSCESCMLFESCEKRIKYKKTECPNGVRKGKK